MNLGDFFANWLRDPRQRAQQEMGSTFSDALPNPLAGHVGGSEMHYNPLRNVPFVGGAINATANIPLHALGLANEGAERLASTTAGEMIILAALASKYGGDDPNSSAGQAAQLALNHGPLHPGRAIESVRTGPDSQLAWAAGALDLAANPLNFTGPIGHAGQAIEAGGRIPMLGPFLKGLGLTGEVVNRGGMLPISLLTRGGREALMETPSFMRAAGAAAPLSREAQGSIEQIRNMNVAPASPALDLNALHGNQRAEFDFGSHTRALGVGPNEYANYAEAAHLPIPGELPFEASPLAPGRTPDLLRTAREAQRAAGSGPKLGPLVPEGWHSPDLLGPELPTAGNIPRGQLIPGIGRNGGRGIGPLLPDLWESPDILGPEFPSRGNVPADQLIPGIGRNGGKGIGPERPIGPVQPEPPPLTPAELRAQTVKGVANGPLANLTAVLRDLHGSVYPNGSTDFAIPSLTGTAARDFRTSLLTDHPGGNAAEPYLDYLISRVQGDPKAAARLGAVNADLLDQIGRVAPHAAPIAEQKRQLQALLGAGEFKASQALPDAPGATAAAATTMDTPALAQALTGDGAQGFAELVASRDSGKMGAYLPGAEFFAKRLGIPAQEAQGYIDDLVRRGVVADERGALAFKPDAPVLQNTPVSEISRPAIAETATPPAVDIPATVEASPPSSGAQPWELTPAQYFEAQYLAGVKRRDYENELTPELLDKHRQVVANAVDWLDKRAGLRAAPPSYASDLNPHYNPSEQILRRDDVYRPGSMASGIFPGEIRSIYEAHRNAVAEAIAAGKPVPEQVLAFYRDLAPKASAATDNAATIARGAAAKADLFGDAADVAPKKLPGGDIAAGGGGMGLTPYVLPAAASRSLVGAGLGGAVGGAAGAAQDKQDRLGGFTRGALIGMGAGAAIGNANAVGKAGQDLIDNLPKALHGMVISPELQAGAVDAAFAKQAAVDAASGVTGVGKQLAETRRQWMRQLVLMPKQLPMDAAQQWVTRWGIAGKEFGVTSADQRFWQSGLATERRTGVSMLDNPVTGWLRDLGLTKQLGDLGETYGVDYGGSLTQGADQQLSTGKRMVAGAAMSGFAGTPTVNPLALAVGAVKGKYGPLIEGYVGFLNGIQHDAARFAMAEKALDRDVPVVASEFLSELARMGHNVKPLEALNGRMSAADVAAVAGKQAGEDWARTAEALVAKQGDRIAYLNGDFRKSSETAAERAIGNVAPFARWSIRYAPVMAEIAARHPRVAQLVGQEMYRENTDAKGQGKPAYQRGITITDKTPGLGLYARLRNAGAEGSTTLDPLGAAMPYGSLLDGGEALPTDATGYQKAVNLAGRVGFSPDPFIQAGAYIGGQDYRAPGSLSRTAGLEASPEALPSLARLGLTMAGRKDLAGAIPDLPQLPSGRALLDAGRNLLEPVTGEKAVAASDPVMRRYSELVMAETHLPLDDEANRDYLAAAGKPNNPLWQRAVAEARIAGAATNLTGLASPVQTSAQTVEAQAAQRAKAAMPNPGVPSYLPSSQQQLATIPNAELAQRAANAAYVAQTPAAGTYNVTNRADGTATLVRDLVTRYMYLGLTYQQAQIQAQYDLTNSPQFGQALAPAGMMPGLIPPRYNSDDTQALRDLIRSRLATGQPMR